MNIQTLGIIGAGQMGNGIAQVCATAGIKVVMCDINAAAVQRGIDTVSANLDRLIKKDKLLAADKQPIIDRIHGTTDLGALAQSDFIVEAATENLELKKNILKDIDALAKPGAIIATNTSSISITRLAATVSRPQQFVGMHFFNPVPVMALVEVIRGIQTSDETYAATEALARRVGKTPIAVKNSPGFVVNRVLVPMINEAAFVLQEGLAKAEEIDSGMQLGANHPIGPLALADLIGLDTCLAVMEVLYREFNDPKYRPAPLLREMVDAGYLGRKAKRGFYTY
ncbi:3-hydroxybutyryl-CoA dehydrogenase [Noviherbaspirillum sp. ST9]|uniref:3-hydroxybutyryl-CoA dehydrogenase n=1 Tax=Noviherbaspirillum sp. ST9 TaxID=3401606 RepID=UPI003B587D48